MQDPETPDAQGEKPADQLSARQAYNIVSDTVVGPNIRLKDNLLQGCAIVVCFVAG